MIEWLKKLFAPKAPTVENHLGYPNLPDEKVASNVALMDLIASIPAEDLKIRLLSQIEKDGLTWNQRKLLESAIAPIVKIMTESSKPLLRNPFPRPPKKKDLPQPTTGEHAYDCKCGNCPPTH